MGDTLSLVLLGFGIVFGVLTVIYLLLQLMAVVFHKKPQPVVAQPVTATPQAEMSEEDEEIAAVVAIVNAIITEENKGWRPTFRNDIGGNSNEKLYSKDKWKNI